MNAESKSPRKGLQVALLAFGAVLLIGLALAAGGVRLTLLGGSWYYLIAGVALAASGILYLRRKPAGAWLFALVVIGTVLWTLWEVGLSFWPLVPRLAPMLVLALFASLLLPALHSGVSRGVSYALSTVLAVAIAAGGMALFFPHGRIQRAAESPVVSAAAAESRWQYYGRTPRGTRFAPETQINRDNVDRLQVAGLAFAASKGIAHDDPRMLAKLRSLRAEQVTDGLSMEALFEAQAGPRTFTTPIVDGRLAVDAVAAYRANRFNRGPMMVGATSGDLFGPEGEMIQGARDIADLLSTQGVEVYYYRFSYIATADRLQGQTSASHASEIPFFFETLDAKYGDRSTAIDQKASDLISNYLINFVMRGNPNGAGVPQWRPHSAAGPAMVEFDTHANAVLHVEP